jgi:hypothetical protein
MNMKSTCLSVLGIALVLAACGSAAAKADDPAGSLKTAQATRPEGSKSASADMAEMQNFRLTDDFLQRYQAYEDEAAEKPCELSPIVLLGNDDDQDRSLGETAAAFDARPGVHAALQRHGLTARELILGMGTLMGAAIHEIAAKHPDMVEKGEIKMNGSISPANMAFYEAHKDALQRHNRQRAQEQLKKNGGKLPACLRK